MELPDVDYESFYTAIERGEYDIIGFSVAHVNMASDLDTIWTLKQHARKAPKRVYFAAGGHMPTLNSEQWLDAGGLDCIFTGYAEENFYRFCRHVAHCAAEGEDDLYDGVMGVVFRKASGELVSRPAPPLTQEQFVALAYDWLKETELPYHRYWELSRKEHGDNLNFIRNKFIVENIRLFTASHCPNRCGFCCSHSFLPTAQGKTTPLWMLSADQIHELLILHVERYGARAVSFNDDDFFLGTRAGRERLFALCDLIRDSKKKGRLPANMTFNAQARIMDFYVSSPEGGKVVDDALIHAIAEVGFCSLGLGMETFVDRLLAAPSINKAGLTVSLAMPVLDGMLAQGLSPQVNIILFIPESTEEEMFVSMKRSVEYILKGCQIAVNPLMYAFPGSGIYGKPGYEMTHTQWTHPETNQVFPIAQYVIPQDKRLRAVFLDVPAAVRKEEEEIRKSGVWAGGALPRAVSGLACYLAVSRLLRRDDMVDYFQRVFDGLVEKHRP